MSSPSSIPHLPSPAGSDPAPRISVVTPTLRRPEEVKELVNHMEQQTLCPFEFILVDGAPTGENETQIMGEKEFRNVTFPCRYVRHGGGTAIQRNVGIEAAHGDFIALIDDDIRLERDFLQRIARVFTDDSEMKVGGVVGFRTNQEFKLESRERWRWYRRLGLLSIYDPGRYDFQTGYPINACMQSAFSGVREVDFMTTACAVWRRQVFQDGLRLDPFFRGYGVLEDAHFSLRARRKWTLLQCGDARCQHLHSPNGRTNRWKIGYMCVVNYYYVFRDVAGPLTLKQKIRFWRYQVFELCRILSSGLRRQRRDDWAELAGRFGGFLAVLTGSAWKRAADEP